MNTQKYCKGCKFLAHDEYWCMSGRSIKAYCKKYERFVRFVKNCVDKTKKEE